MTLEEYINKQFSEYTFKAEGEIGNCTDYMWRENDELGELLELAEPQLFARLSEMYPNCQLEKNSFWGPGNEFNLHISVRS